MKNQGINLCLDCDCWDSDRNGCSMPSSDKWYACPIKQLPNEELEKYSVNGIIKKE